MRSLLISLTLIFAMGCANNEQPLRIPGNPTEDGSDKSITDAAKTSVFLLDGKEKIFTNIEWSFYDFFPNHRVWSLFDIYAIQTPDGRLFRMQIKSYYDPENIDRAGVYTLRIQEQGEEMKEITFNALACGNANSTASNQDCLNDPDQNARTYLNLADMSLRKLSDDKAAQDKDWNIGFKSTDIILNEGSELAESTLGGLIYRDPEIAKIFADNPAGLEDPDAFELLKTQLIPVLQKKVQSNLGISSFNNNPLAETVALQSPSFMDEVIAQNLWTESKNGNLKPISKNWWLIRSFDKKNVYTFNVAIIEPNTDGRHRIEFLFQATDSENKQNYDFILNLTTDEMTKCINFSAGVSVDCEASNNWDLKFVKKVDDGTSAGKIYTQQGAQGPLSQDEIDSL
ncbi:MAG: hypothetical protein HRT44_07230 [Bdellovibrionales bacterium]|nr:hypothetical protein [Bdellovibrionales bacterium]NQZ19029.1 hypothetical protein [Bdellovibrionales bacterium]